MIVNWLYKPVSFSTMTPKNSKSKNIFVNANITFVNKTQVYCLNRTEMVVNCLYKLVLSIMYMFEIFCLNFIFKHCYLIGCEQVVQTAIQDAR